MWAWDREVVQVTLKQTPASNPSRPRHSPQTDPDGGLGRGRLNSARLSSKNSTSQMTASYNGPHAEGGPGLWGRKTVTERREGEGVDSVLEEGQEKQDLDNSCGHRISRTHLSLDSV